MERIPAFVDDMGETVFADDLRLALFFIKARCRQGLKSLNKTNRLKNKAKARKAEVLRKAQAEQRAEDLYLHLSIPQKTDAELHFIPRTNRWDN